MPWVKICGITTEETLDAVIDGGADAVGFVLAPDSPRALSVDRAADLMRAVPITRFIVTVDLTPAEALSLAELTGADGIQNHGLHATEVAAEATDAGYLSLHPVRVGVDGPETDIASIPSQSLPLFDTAAKGRHGGTGIAFDWTVLDSPGRPFVLAGGLGPSNVADAIALVNPFGVDASSGLESAPGVKDPVRIIDFINEAKGI
jgi:phosphoribosylanthranilate isomerase